MNRKHTPISEARLRAYHLAGKTQVEIAKAEGVSLKTITRRFRLLGLRKIARRV